MYSSSSRLMQLHKLKVDITKEIGVTYRHTKVTVQRITKNGMTTDTDRKIYPVSIQKGINLYCRTLRDTIVPAPLLHFDRSCINCESIFFFFYFSTTKYEQQLLALH